MVAVTGTGDGIDSTGVGSAISRACAICLSRRFLAETESSCNSVTVISRTFFSVFSRYREIKVKCWNAHKIGNTRTENKA